MALQFITSLFIFTVSEYRIHFQQQVDCHGNLLNRLRSLRFNCIGWAIVKSRLLGDSPVALKY